MPEHECGYDVEGQTILGKGISSFLIDDIVKIENEVGSLSSKSVWRNKEKGYL